MSRSPKRPITLLDIIGRTDTSRARSAQKKGPYLGAFGISKSDLQSCPGNLFSYSSSNSFKIPLAVSLIRAFGALFSYHLTLCQTIWPKNINCSSVKLLYIFILFISFGCGSLRGGLTLKYDEVAREGEAVILECETHVVNSESQEKIKNTLQGVKNSETSKTIPPAVKTPIQK